MRRATDAHDVLHRTSFRPYTNTALKRFENWACFGSPYNHACRRCVLPLSEDTQLANCPGPPNFEKLSDSRGRTSDVWGRGRDRVRTVRLKRWRDNDVRILRVVVGPKVIRSSKRNADE